MSDENNNPIQTPFERKVSLTTALIAVALSISAIYASMLGDMLLIARREANNQWAKSLKQHLQSIQQGTMELELEQQQLSDHYRERVILKIRDFEAEIKRYEQEKIDIKLEVDKQEKLYQNLDNQCNILNYGEALYEISIIMAAISLLARSRLMWLTSIGLGVAGLHVTLHVYLYL